MQQYGEFAVREHLGNRTAGQFFKDIAKKKNRPFDFRVSKEEIDGIMITAMKRSVRYKVLTGKQCGNCERPHATSRKPDARRRQALPLRPGPRGLRYLVAGGERGRTSPRSFDTPTKMRVFSWRGEIDTTMSPMDSIRYYKSFLQSGLLSMDPHTGFVKAWVGGIDFKHFQYDHVEQARRQVGSTFKPFVYATAIREGMEPVANCPTRRVCFDMPPASPIGARRTAMPSTAAW
jgi:penicillin-binding protein 1A